MNFPVQIRLNIEVGENPAMRFICCSLLAFHFFICQIPAKFSSLLRISQHNNRFDYDIGEHCQSESDDCPH